MGPKWQNRTTNGKYFVSTSNVMFSGWETMVFPIHDNGEIYYSELDVEKYLGENEAYSGHIQMFNKWENK